MEAASRSQAWVEIDLDGGDVGEEDDLPAVDEIESDWARLNVLVERERATRSTRSENIVVVTRIRPFSGREIECDAECCLEVHGDQVWIRDPAQTTAPKPPVPLKFQFDGCFNSTDQLSPTYFSQRRVFETVGLDILAKIWSGFNSCLFAYGQTGSGKTFSMMGYVGDKGMTPRICEALFCFASRGESFKVEASYLQVYNETVIDLLPQVVPRPASPQKAKAPAGQAGRKMDGLRLREDPTDGTRVEGLRQYAVTSFPECEALLAQGLKNRVMAATKMNHDSSRSHCVFTLELKKQEATFSKVKFVDLAGSESAKNAGTKGDQLAEGNSIRKSLLALQNVIATLAAKADPESKASGHVPFRDSALTRILKDSLGGNSKTVLLATLSPASLNYHETLSTLRFAAQAKKIQLHPVPIDEQVPKSKIREFHAGELERLKKELASATAEISRLEGLKNGGSCIEELLETAQGSVERLQALLDEKMKEVEVIEAGMAAEMEARDAEYAERVENMRELLEARVKEAEAITARATAELEQFTRATTKKFAAFVEKMEKSADVLEKTLRDAKLRTEARRRKKELELSQRLGRASTAQSESEAL